MRNFNSRFQLIEQHVNYVNYWSQVSIMIEEQLYVCFPLKLKIDFLKDIEICIWLQPIYKVMEERIE